VHGGVGDFELKNCANRESERAKERKREREREIEKKSGGVRVWD
jgi:hypothetical protein